MLYHLVVHVPRNINGSGLCAISPKHRCRTSYATRARAPPCVLCARSREGDRARYHRRYTPLKAGAFQMFHCVYRVTERPRAPTGLSRTAQGAAHCASARMVVLGFWLQISATRREALCALPWAVWDDPRLSGYLYGAICTVRCLNNGGGGPLIEWFDLAKSQSQKSVKIHFGD